MKDKQIIRIEGKEDEWYQEAIFILREDVMSYWNYKDLQQKADEIIGNHAKKSGLRPQDNTRSIDKLLNILLFGSICIFVICLYLL